MDAIVNSFAGLSQSKLQTPLEPPEMSSATRSSQTAALFGPEFAQKIINTRILVVGSGGIGCELRT